MKKITLLMLALGVSIITMRAGSIAIIKSSQKIELKKFTINQQGTITVAHKSFKTNALVTDTVLDYDGIIPCLRNKTPYGQNCAGNTDTKSRTGKTMILLAPSGTKVKVLGYENP